MRDSGTSGSSSGTYTDTSTDSRTDTAPPSIDAMLRCPFCGGSNVTPGLIGMTEKFLGISYSERIRWFIRCQCLDCGTRQGYDESHPCDGLYDQEVITEAVKAWNRRSTLAPAPPVEGMVEKIVYDAYDEWLQGPMDDSDWYAIATIAVRRALATLDKPQGVGDNGG